MQKNQKKINVTNVKKKLQVLQQLSVDFVELAFVEIMSSHNNTDVILKLKLKRNQEIDKWMLL
jgi:hypothetical protein